jgi:hypothetical protein
LFFVCVSVFVFSFVAIIPGYSTAAVTSTLILAPQRYSNPHSARCQSSPTSTEPSRSGGGPLCVAVSRLEFGVQKVKNQSGDRQRAVTGNGAERQAWSAGGECGTISASALNPASPRAFGLKRCGEKAGDAGTFPSRPHQVRRSPGGARGMAAAPWLAAAVDGYLATFLPSSEPGDCPLRRSPTLLCMCMYWVHVPTEPPDPYK